MQYCKFVPIYCMTNIQYMTKDSVLFGLNCDIVVIVSIKCYYYQLLVHSWNLDPTPGTNRCILYTQDTYIYLVGSHHFGYCLLFLDITMLSSLYVSYMLMNTTLAQVQNRYTWLYSVYNILTRGQNCWDGIYGP